MTHGPAMKSGGASPPNEIGFDLLLRYHREVLMPDVREAIAASERAVGDEMHTLFDGVYARLDRLESEVQSLKAVYNV